MTESEHLARMERALAYGGPTHTVADVVRLVREGEAQFWQRGDGCIVTEIHATPLRKTCHYWLAFGALGDCLALQPEIDEWARGQGCTIATLTGRKGWCRAAVGWEPGLPTYRKDLVA